MYIERDIRHWQSLEAARVKTSHAFRHAGYGFPCISTRISHRSSRTCPPKFLHPLPVNCAAHAQDERKLTAQGRRVGRWEFILRRHLLVRQVLHAAFCRCSAEPPNVHFASLASSQCTWLMRSLCIQTSGGACSWAMQAACLHDISTVCYMMPESIWASRRPS